MNQEEIEKLKEIFHIIFYLDLDADATTVREINTKNWDSMAHVSLIAAIESELNINIDAAEAMRMTSFQATLLLIEEKLA